MIFYLFRCNGVIAVQNERKKVRDIPRFNESSQDGMHAVGSCFCINCHETVAVPSLGVRSGEEFVNK